MEQTNLIKLAELMARHISRSEATVSTWCVGHARLFKRLRENQGCTIKTANRALHWFHTNWPEDLEWPSDIPRPKKPKKEAA